MDDEITSSATVATGRPGRYGKQLVAHLSRRSPGSWDDQTGTGVIRFDGGTARLASTSTALTLQLTTSPELVDRLEDVLGRHLVRFATRDTLDVQWQRNDGRPGTHQTSQQVPDEQHGSDRNTRTTTTADEFFTDDRTASREGPIELPTDGYRGYLHDPQSPVVAQYRGQRWDVYSAERTSPSFVQELLADWRRLYDEPFRGVTTDGEVRRDLYGLPERSASDPALRHAAEHLLGVLTPTQRAQVGHPIDDRRWRAWSNPEFVIHEVGLRLEDLPDAAVAAVHRVLRAALSPEGYLRVRTLMELNGFLGDLVELPTVMNERSYWFSLFGEPSDTEPWGWQLFGHHVAIAFVTVGGRHVIAPLFLGAEPAVLDDGQPGVFDDRESAALRLAGSLTTAQRESAVVYDSVLDPHMPEGRLHPADERHVAGAFRDNRVVPVEGIRCDHLDDAQRALVLAIAEDALLLLAEPQRRLTLDEVAAHIDDTWFAWYGATDGSQPFYFRIQGPTIIAELDHHAGVWLANPTPARFHVHTVLRLPNGGDYGRALIAQHRARLGSPVSSAAWPTT